jgi:pilus assembly protein FimV
MIITCKECNANFKLDESLLKPTGSKVRCSKCNEIFTAYPPKILEENEVPIELELDVEDQKVTEGLEVDKKETTDPDELDFSDMDKLIDDDEAPKSEDILDEDTDDLDLDLELDIEPETEKSKEDLGAKVDQEASDELDLSDLENLLDEEEVAGESQADETFEDLDLKISPETDVSMEKMPPSAETEELELDMETEPELEKVSEGDEAEDLEEVDLSEIEKMLEVEEETEGEPLEKEMALELDMEETPADTTLYEDSSQVEVYELDEAEDRADEPETAEAAITEERGREFEVGESEDEDQVEDETFDEERLAEETTPAQKRRVSKPLVVLLILVLLAGGSYGTYVLLDFMNIEVPFISDYFKPKVSDPNGSLKIDSLDVNSKFLLNVKEGKLFVITGRVKNGYPDVRRFISINGKLYKKGKILAQTEKVFCGNVLSDIELSNMDLEAIKKRLSNRVGDNKSNMEIKPGGELPFMIIFSNLPEDLEEFSIEVAGSTSASG